MHELDPQILNEHILQYEACIKEKSMNILAIGNSVLSRSSRWDARDRSLRPKERRIIPYHIQFHSIHLMSPTVKKLWKIWCNTLLHEKHHARKIWNTKVKSWWGFAKKLCLKTFESLYHARTIFCIIMTIHLPIIWSVLAGNDESWKF